MEKLRLDMLTLPGHLDDQATWNMIVRYHFIYSIAGLILGFMAIFFGIVLFLMGISGSTTWVAEMIGAKSKITDAAPGVILFIVGLLIVYITRFSAKVRKLINSQKVR
ncbi:MAG: hypothetical protein HKP58_09810 [Desulfatitalea sp.]|nr:hypothetical protein [Desulfatitalea sp.]NNK00697.1 hypothetical protein [Desulfatitalea sp.]